MYRLLTFLLLFIISPTIEAQTLPKENSRFNYRIIGFAFPQNPKAKGYTLEIAVGNYNSADSFEKNIILSLSSKNNKLIAETPFFGWQYTWRVLYNDNKKRIRTGDLHHFFVNTSPRVDTALLRLRILHSGRQYKDDYVAVESGGVLYDMGGSPVWFIPDTNGIDGYVGDLRFTPAGTVTFLYGTAAYEISFNGDVLWKSPGKDIITGKPVPDDYYHHEFVRLSNGHFMVLGMQLMKCKSIRLKDTAYILSTDSLNMQNGYRIARFGVIIEYDQKGNVVWSWMSSKYLLGSDFDYFNPTDSTNRFEPHENSFFFDETNKIIYLGFRNLNRIIKIEYPGGKVIKTYGENFKPGERSDGSGLFCNQHGVCLTKEGYLCYFNNNSCDNTDSLPTIVMLREPVSPDGDLKKNWEYRCPIEKGIPHKFSRGGNVIELPGRAVFVCMAGNYSKLFIVDPGEKLLWSAIPEKFMVQDKKWKATQGYRAYIISRKELERMVWNAEK